jgi:hypothetical protein
VVPQAPPTIWNKSVVIGFPLTVALKSRATYQTMIFGRCLRSLFQTSHTNRGSALLELRQGARLLQCLRSPILIVLENRPGDPQLLHLVDQSGAL